MGFANACAFYLDVQPGNVVFTLSAFEIDEALGHSTPTLAKVKWLDGVAPDSSAPEYLVVPEPIYSQSVLEGRLGDIEANLIDFGAG